MDKKRTNPGYLTQYAKHAGLSKEGVRKQLARVGIDYLQPFDFADADRKRAAARHADRAQFAKPIYADKHSETDADVDEQTKKDPKFVESQARREMFKAKLTELEYLERVGTLVRKDKVEEEAFRKWRIARDAILSIPDRLAGLLAAQTDLTKCRELLRAELRRVLVELAGGEPREETTHG